MAIRCDAAGEDLRRTASLPSAASFTVCGWLRVQAIAATSTFVSIAQTTTQLGLQFSAAGVLVLTSAADVSFTRSPPVGQWFFWALRCSGTGAGLAAGYFRGLREGILTKATGTRAAITPDTLWFMNNASAEPTNGRIAGIKVWDAVLTDAEILRESFQLAPARRYRLHLWAQENTVADLSGRGRVLTKTGTLTYEPGPPIPLFANQPIILDHINTTAPAASADISSAGAAVATLATQSLASANLSSTAAASAVFASASTVPANLTSAGAASMILATNVLAKADLSSVGAASAVFTSQSSASANLSMAGSAAATLASAATASADLAMAGAATGTLASAALASVALSMAGTATAIFEASAQAQGQADLSIAGSASAVFGAQALASADIAAAGASTAILESSSVGVASADFAAAGSASAVFGATSTGGAGVETPVPPSQAVGGPGGGGRSKRRKRHDEELALIAEAMGEVFERMVRGELIEGEIEINLRRTLH